MELKMKTGFVFALLVVFIACVICVGWVGIAGASDQSDQPTPTLAPTMNPEITPTSTPIVITYNVYAPIVIRNVSSGMATITGWLVIDGVYPVYLAEVFRDEDTAIFILDLAWSHSVLPEEDGYFIFENIEPLEYVIIVGNPLHGRSWIITDDDKIDTAMVWITMKNKTLNVGKLIIDTSWNSLQRRLIMKNDDPGHDAAEDVLQTENDDHYGDMADTDD